MSESAARPPALVVVDDEPAVLAAIARDLRRGFGERYRIVRVGSGEEALDVLREVVRRGEQVALLVADQRMPGLSGTDYLVRAREIVPFGTELSAKGSINSNASSGGAFLCRTTL